MTILTFSARAVAAQIAHARGCAAFLPNWNGPVGHPALILIVGHGVHVRSNGIDGISTRVITTEATDPSFAYADGLNPFQDRDWMTRRHSTFGDLTGQFYTDLLEGAQGLIDAGRGIVRLSTDGTSVQLFTRAAYDYLVGGIYRVPSGLGGTFRVVLQDVTGSYAVVRNCGNCEEFDAMQPYRVPLDTLLEADDRRTA